MAWRVVPVTPAPETQWFHGYWDQRPPRVLQSAPDPAPPPFVSWEGTVNTTIVWGSYFWEGNYQMYEHRHPVRLNDPQEIRYRYRDQDGIPIDLTNYQQVFLLVKFQGATYETAAAEFQDKAAGRVIYHGYSFGFAGDWTVQFVCVDGLNKKRHGDPARLKLVDNIEDLDLNELMVY